MATVDIDKLVETLSNLSVLDLANLKKALETKWGVQAAAAAPMMVASAAAPAAAEQAAESTEFKVTLEEAPADKRIAIIKVVREVTGLGLKEAKELVGGAPKVIKEKAPKAEAQDIVKKLQQAGAKASSVGL